MKTLNHTFQSYKVLEDFLLQENLRNPQTLLIQVFDGVLDQQLTKELLDLLAALLPQAIIIGTSTDGEIISGKSFVNSIVLSFSIFESSSLHLQLVNIDKGSFDAGVLLGKSAKNFGAKAMILFSDALHTNGDELMNGINSVDYKCVVAGGMAGDNARFEQTYVIFQNNIYFKSAVAVFLKGEALQVCNRSSFHWEAIGPKFIVTKSIANRLYTLNDTPIADIYKEYLGEEVAELLPKVGVAFPLIINMQSYKVGRAPLSLFEDGSMGFGGNIEEGSEVQFGVGNLNQILQSSKKTFDYMAQESIESIFIYSCTARKTFMGQFIDKELAPLQELAPTTGFFTYGEFFTHNKAKTCSLLNETMTTLALSENKQSSPHKDFALKFFENDSYENITSRALLHFVNKTSSELQELNTMLEKRVQDEVLLNHEKEKLILAQSRRATMGEMTRMIAHQWRQPLSSIGLAIDNLMLDVMLNDVNPQNIEETSKIVKNQVHYLSKTINDFSNYFEPENIVESFNAKELFSELMNMIGHDLHQHNIEVFTNFLNLEEIHSYKRELFQICLNLFNNAKDVLLQKNVKHKYIKLTYRFIDGHHEIHISDNAGGVSDEIKEKIFEPYFSTKVQKNGTGLGLYMSKTIAQSYLEGDLSCSNDKQGAIFLLQFKNKSQEGEKK